MWKCEIGKKSAVAKKSITRVLEEKKIYICDLCRFNLIYCRLELIKSISFFLFK